MKRLIVLVVVCFSVTACATAQGPVVPFPTADVDELEVNTSRSDRLRRSDLVNPRDGAPYRTYQIALNDGDVLRIVVETPDFSPGLSLFGPDGTLVGSTEVTRQRAAVHHDPYGHHGYGAFGYDPFGHYGHHGYGAGHGSHDSATGRRSLIRRASEPGMYTVVVSSLQSNEYGSYSLLTETVETAQTLTLPGETTGFLYEGGKVHPMTGSLLNTYPLEVTAEMSLELKLSSRDFSPMLTLVEASSERVLMERRPGMGERDVTLVTKLPPGQYELWVSSGDGGPDGQYRLHGQETTIDVSESFTLGQIYRGFLGWDLEPVTSSFRTGKPLTFTLDEPAILDALMQAQGFNSYLVLTDERGRILVEDDSSGFSYETASYWYNPGVYDARIYWPLEPGTYTLWAAAAMEGEFGTYQISTSLQEAPSEEAVRVGGTVRGALTQASGYHPTRYTPVEYITLEVTEHQEVQVEVRDTELMTYLIIEDEWGSVVAETDPMSYYEYGAGPRRLRHVLAPGTYRLAVGSVGYGALGGFTVHVRAAGPSPDQG